MTEPSLKDKTKTLILENPVVPKTTSMLHKEAVRSAASYLSKRCSVVLPEFFSWNDELADVIGFQSRHSVIIECKVSRSDFLADMKKSFRAAPDKGMGDYRYYCCPKGLIKPEELPIGWGLLYIYPSGKVRRVKDSYYPPRENADLAEDWKRGGKFPKNIDSEHHLLFYYARRANYAGVHQHILDYRGFDK